MLYLYAIIDPARGPLLLPPGLEDAKVCVVPFDGLAAAVSALDRPPGHETREVCRHMDVLSALIERHTVLPVRFGTAFPSREDLERSISDARESLTADLRRLSGQIEFGITVTGQEPPLPPEVPPQPHGEAQGPGALYLAAKRAEAELRLTRDRANEALAARVSGAFAQLVTETTWQALPPAGERMRVSLALLIPHGRTPDFRLALAGLRRSAPDLDILCTGPWPAYSFTSGTALPGRNDL